MKYLGASNEQSQQTHYGKNSVITLFRVLPSSIHTQNNIVEPESDVITLNNIDDNHKQCLQQTLFSAVFITLK